MCWICGRQNDGRLKLNAETADAAYGVSFAQANAPLPVYSIAQVADQLLNGYWSWSGSNANRWAVGNTDITYNLTGLTADRAALARLAFATWSDVINLTFTETTGTAELTLDDDESGAFSSSSYSISGGGTWTITSSRINVETNWEPGQPGTDSYTFSTFIHEIGHSLGLGHGGNYNGSATYGTSNHYSNDTMQYSIMSYMDQINYGEASNRHNFTPQMADIHAVQSYYGAATTRTGDTTYGFNTSGLSGLTAQLYKFSNFSQAPSVTIYDSGGSDTLDFSGYTQNQRIDLAGGAWSNVGGLVANVGIYLTSVIENAVGGSGNDTILGNAANNTLNGGGGDDSFTGFGGNDTINGSSGNDTANFTAARNSYSIVSQNGAAVVSGYAPDGLDILLNIESFSFSDGTVSISSLPAFQPYEYLASHADLIIGIGGNTDAAWNHYLSDGAREGRSLDSFGNFRYIASFSDLTQAYGANSQAGAAHFVNHGYREGRASQLVDFREYAATHSDLLNAFGMNQEALALHYIQHGRAEGRAIDLFDNLRYTASYNDLIEAFGVNQQAAVQHYVQFGFSENRDRHAFDPLQYIASYGDLINGFGLNAHAATVHFIQNGRSEGRSRDNFNAAQYLASYADLQAAFGNNEAAATRHFIEYGFAEGRTGWIL